MPSNKGINFDKLNDSQLEIAEKIVNEAKKQGVDPDFALSLAWAENRFTDHKSPKGAIGPMQLMPKTAKNLHVDPHNIDENIQGGITYLKQGLEKFEGDKTKAAIGYNAGHNHRFFTTGKIEHIPQESVDYVAKINENYPLTEDHPSEPVQTEQASTQTEEAVSPTAGRTFDGSEDNSQEVADAQTSSTGETVPDVDPKQIAGTKELQKGALDVGGALLGAGTAAGIETGKKVLPLVPNLYSQIMGLDQNINRPTTRTSMQNYLNSQLNHNVNLRLSDLEKEQNALLKARNPGTAPTKIRTMAEVQEALRALKPTATERVKKGASYVMNQGSPGIDLSKYEVNAKTPVRNTIRQAARTAGDVTRSALPSAARIGLGALGGVGLLGGGYDTYEHVKEHGWNPRALSKAAGTVGGGLMMIPTPITEGLGLALSAPELALTGYDYLTKK